MGVVIPEVVRWPGTPTGGEGVCCLYDATLPGSVTGTEDGRPVAPLMGDFTDYDGGFIYVEIGPASFFLAYPDYGVMYLFVPKGPQETEMRVLWLVKNDAKEGRDYDRARLTWMWDVTNLADKRIVRNNQRGVNTRFYWPGPFGPMEQQASSFVEWYLKQIR